MQPKIISQWSVGSRVDETNLGSCQECIPRRISELSARFWLRAVLTARFWLRAVLSSLILWLFSGLSESTHFAAVFVLCVGDYFSGHGLWH